MDPSSRAMFFLLYRWYYFLDNMVDLLDHVIHLTSLTLLWVSKEASTGTMKPPVSDTADAVVAT